jgi:hypothetical protein
MSATRTALPADRARPSEAQRSSAQNSGCCEGRPVPMPTFGDLMAVLEKRGWTWRHIAQQKFGDPAVGVAEQARLEAVALVQSAVPDLTEGLLFTLATQLLQELHSRHSAAEEAVVLTKAGNNHLVGRLSERGFPFKSAVVFSEEQIGALVATWADAVKAAELDDAELTQELVDKCFQQACRAEGITPTPSLYSICRRKLDDLRCAGPAHQADSAGVGTQPAAQAETEKVA